MTQNIAGPFFSLIAPPAVILPQRQLTGSLLRGHCLDKLHYEVHFIVQLQGVILRRQEVKYPLIDVHTVETVPLQNAEQKARLFED